MIMWIFLSLAVLAALIIGALIGARYYGPILNFASDIYNWAKARFSKH